MSLQLPYGYRNIEKFQKSLGASNENVWIKRGERKALRLFHEMAENVPAYKDFLKKHKVDHTKIKTIADFKTVPLIDKDNYLRQYPREMLVWDGDFKNQSWVISSTSGSSGKPYYFPRLSKQDMQYTITADLYLRSNFQVHQKSTLYIVAFPMGAWIGGLFTYEAVKTVAEMRGYPLSIITPGIHKKEIINAVKELGGDFDQIIIGSYAPFLKDFIEDGEKEGVNWEDYNLGFVFSAEVFSETFRDYLVRKVGLENACRQTLNHYGTVDLGTMAHETPASILLRRKAVEDPNLFIDFFKQSAHLPTFAQYLPEMFYFEVVDGNNLVCSADSGIPLVRYDLKDRGGLLKQSEVQSILHHHRYDFDKLMGEQNVNDTVWNLPYVHVYERSDFSVSFYAFQIYPETIRKALQRKELIERLTGKFTMKVSYNSSGRQELEVNIELAGGETSDKELELEVQQKIVQQLLKENSEYRETHKHYKSKVYPIIKFWPYEDPKYFKTGTKQRWVENERDEK